MLISIITEIDKWNCNLILIVQWKYHKLPEETTVGSLVPFSSSPSPNNQNIHQPDALAPDHGFYLMTAHRMTARHDRALNRLFRQRIWGSIFLHAAAMQLNAAPQAQRCSRRLTYRLNENHAVVCQET